MRAFNVSAVVDTATAHDDLTDHVAAVLPDDADADQRDALGELLDAVFDSDGLWTLLGDGSEQLAVTFSGSPRAGEPGPSTGLDHVSLVVNVNARIQPAGDSPAAGDVPPPQV